MQYKDQKRFEGEICFLMKNKKIDAIGFGLELTHANIQNRMKQKGLDKFKHRFY